MFVKLQGKLCVVVGGGKVATRKVNGLLTAGGEVIVISPEVTEQLHSLHQAGRIKLQLREYQAGDLRGAIIAVAATNREEINLAVSREAEQRMVWLNDALNPERSTFHVPASHIQGDLHIAVSTSGASPSLARTIKEELSHLYDERYARFVRWLALMRSHLQERGASEEEKRNIFKRCVKDKERLLQMMKSDYSEESLAKLVERMIVDEASAEDSSHDEFR